MTGNYENIQMHNCNQQHNESLSQNS